MGHPATHKEGAMQRKFVRLIFVHLVVLAAAWLAQAQDAKTPYPEMAPLNQYLIADRNAEIALARSAAPKSISDQAEILVLTEHGYETAAKGTNGFVCVVERSWTAGAAGLQASLELSDTDIERPSPNAQTQKKAPSLPVQTRSVTT
jgi:hypothetical protein